MELGLRILVGLGMLGFAVISFLASADYNEITGERQYVSLTEEQEIALGLEAAPQLIEEFGGLEADPAIQARIDEIGERLVRLSVANRTEWRFEFYVLDDDETVNAFALPGGPVFITMAMLNQLESEDEVAGVLAHEIVHILARHGAQRIAKSDLTNGLIGAVAIASGDASATQISAMVGQLVNLSYGRGDEIESDTLGVCLMLSAEYDPRGMIGVMETLQAARTGGISPEFFSTHPNPDNRIERIEAAIANAQTDCPR